MMQKLNNSKYMKKLDKSEWDSLKMHSKFFESKESVIRRILNDAQKSLYKNAVIRYLNNDYQINLYPFRKGIKFSIKEVNSGATGWYNYHKREISLNPNIFMKNTEDGGRQAYYMAMHELRHDFQRCLIKNKDFVIMKNNELQEYIDSMKAYMDGIININLFGFNSIGCLHINPFYDGKEIPDNQKNENIDSLTHMLYFTNYSEHDAFCFQLECGDNSLEGIVPFSMGVFYERYECYGFDFDDILKEVNDGILNVYQGVKPKDSLQASVIYDISCLSLLQARSITEQECIELLSVNEKEKRMQLEGFSLSDDVCNEFSNLNSVVSESDFISYMVNPQKFELMSDDELKKNPKLVLYMAAIKQSQGANTEYLATDNLKDYCSSNSKQLLTSDIYKNGIAAIFGDVFIEEISILDENDAYIDSSNGIEINNHLDFGNDLDYYQEEHMEECDSYDNVNNSFCYSILEDEDIEL